jgi:adenylate cyclase
MAFWGAPLEDPDHALHGVTAALQMLVKVQVLNEDFAARGWPRIKIGIGLGSGPMSVGNMGSEFRMAYTVLGDTVNVGSRLEGLTKIYDVGIIVSETTAQAVPGHSFRELDFVRVKGKNKPIRIYEPIGETSRLDGAVVKELELLEQAYDNFRGQQWDQARDLFRRLEQKTGHAVYRIYQDRVEHYRANPPGEQWDGVYTHVTK